MRFKYLGDKTQMIAFGYDFSNGQIPDVQDMNAIKKLSHNNHFESQEIAETVDSIAQEPKKRGRKPNK